MLIIKIKEIYAINKLLITCLELNYINRKPPVHSTLAFLLWHGGISDKSKWKTLLKLQAQKKNKTAFYEN